MPSSNSSSAAAAAAADAAARKTVSCELLEAAFAKNPHPDGKTMTALAERLKLNKKQVSNFFERERRKANIVIESRRKGGNGGGSSGNSSNGSVNGSAAKMTTSSGKKLIQSQQRASPSSQGVRSASAKKTSPSPLAAPITLKQRQTSQNQEDAASSSSLPNKRSTRAVVKKTPSYRVFEDDDDEEEEDAEGEDDDFDGADLEEYEDDHTHTVPSAAVVFAEEENNGLTVSLIEQYREEAQHVVEQHQNPLVQKNKDEAFFNRTGASASSRYASRNARYASRSPLYAFPAAQAPDNFRTAPIPPQMRRTASASPSVASRRSCSPLTAGSGHAQTTLLPAFGYASKNLAPPGMNTNKSEGSRASSLVDEEASACGSLKRKRGSALSESPTVMFLRNPFPAPVPPQAQFPLRPEITRQASFQSMLEDDSMTGIYGDAAEFAAASGSSNITLDAYQPIFRKRARVWFGRPSGDGESTDLSLESIIMASSSQESAKSRASKPVADAAQPVNSEPRPSRTTVRKEAKTRTDAMSDLDGLDSSDESDFGDDGGLKPRKKDNRPGAALRTNIACKELKQAFMSNPHPPADVLEALAIRLGLGKKQVSNYFVRERKKAGYTIKIRHGLHRRRGPNKRRVDKPAVVVTQHDFDGPLDANSTSMSSQAMTEANMAELAGEEEEEEEESDDGASDLGSHMDDMSIDPSIYTSRNESRAINKDDVPDLSYDEQDLATSTRNTFEDSSMLMSSLMAPSKSMESMTTSSRQDEDEELASPPFEAVHLPPTDASHKTSASLHTGLLNFEGHVLPASSNLQYI